MVRSRELFLSLLLDFSEVFLTWSLVKEIAPMAGEMERCRWL